MASIRPPFYPGYVSQEQQFFGDSAGRFDETRAQESPGLPLLVRSSMAGREVRHHFAWTKHIGVLRQDGMAMAAGYPVAHAPKIINSTPNVGNRADIQPQMSSYPRPRRQGGMRVLPRFQRASPIKQNSYRSPTY